MLEVPTPRSVKSESPGWVGPRPPCFLEGPRRPQTVVGSRTENPLPPAPAGPEPQSTPSRAVCCSTQIPSVSAAAERASSVHTKGEEVPSSQPTTARSAPTWRFSLLTPWGELRGGNRHNWFVFCHLSLKSVQGLIVLLPGV